MIEKSLESLKMGKMSAPKHKGRVLRLLWVQDIFTKPNENYYKVLFHDIESGIYIRESIFPEFLSYFTLGACYKDGILFKSTPPIGETFSISVESSDNNQFKRISEVIKDDEYNLSNSFTNSEGKLINFTEENKHQYCIVFQNDRQTIIFPCVVIGTAFYFTSTSMREQIFAQNLKGLYESGSLNRETKEARIIMKPGAANSDTKRIVRFATDKFAKDKWHAIKNNLFQEKKSLLREGKDGYFVPLRIDFPVREVFQLDVRALKLTGKDNNKEKILVLEILREHSLFEFKRVFRVRREHKTKPLEGENIIPVKAHKTTAVITHNTPSSELAIAIINNPVEDKSAAADDIEIIDEYIPAEESDIHNVYENSEQKADISVTQHSWSGDKHTRRGIVDQKPKKKEDPNNKQEDNGTFTLEDFIKMAEGLPEHTVISVFEIHEKGYVPFKHEGLKQCSLKESYDKTTENRRQFVYVTFQYEGKSVCLVEIDQSRLPNGASTYVLVLKGDYGITKEDAEFLLKLYVDNSKMEEIRKEFAIKEIGFLCKKHPERKAEENYKTWRARLLERIHSINT